MAEWNWKCYSCMHNRNTIPPCDLSCCAYACYDYDLNNETRPYYWTKDGTKSEEYLPCYNGTRAYYSKEYQGNMINNGKNDCLILIDKNVDYCKAPSIIFYNNRKYVLE